MRLFPAPHRDAGRHASRRLPWRRVAPHPAPAAPPCHQRGSGEGKQGMRRPREQVMHRRRARYCVRVGTAAAAAACWRQQAAWRACQCRTSPPVPKPWPAGPEASQAGRWTLRLSVRAASGGLSTVVASSSALMADLCAMQGVWRRLAAIRVPFMGQAGCICLQGQAHNPQATSVYLAASQTRQRCSRRWGRTVLQPARLLMLPDSAREY